MLSTIDNNLLWYTYCEVMISIKLYSINKKGLGIMKNYHYSLSWEEIIYLIFIIIKI